MSPKSRAAVVSILVAASLTLIKATVGWLTLSIAVLASALDSLMDVFSTGVALAGVRTAEKPADEKHQFGHGKAEAIAGLIQAAFILASAIFLITHAFRRIARGYQLEDETVGIAVMVVAIISSALLARYLRNVGRQTESVALTGSALNFGADVWTNIGVIIALVLERWAHVTNADPVISILISLYIAFSALRVGHEAITQLMDRALPQNVIAIIDRCIRQHEPMVHGYHRLRTRQVGAEKHIEFHLEIDRHLSFEEAHAMTETIVADIGKAIPGAQVTAHSDPV